MPPKIGAEDLRRPMPARPGYGAPAARLAEILRVDHAGELADQALAVEQGAREAPAYPLLAAVIKAGCRIAIRAAEKV